MPPRKKLLNNPGKGLRIARTDDEPIDGEWREKNPPSTHVASGKRAMKRPQDIVLSKEEGDITSEQFDVVESAANELGWTYVPVRTLPVNQKLAKVPRGFWYRDELWMFVMFCLEKRVRKFEIKRLLKRFVEAWGFESTLHQPTFEKILSRARAELRLQTELSREDHIAEGYESMRQIIADPEASVADKIKAQQTINDMLGLSAKYTQQGETDEDRVKKIQRLLEEEASGYEDE